MASSPSAGASFTVSSEAASGADVVLLAAAPGLPRAKFIRGPGRRGLTADPAGEILALDLAVVLDAPSSEGDESWCAADSASEGALVVTRPLDRRLNDGLGRVSVDLEVELGNSSCSLEDSVELGLPRVVPNLLLSVG